MKVKFALFGYFLVIISLFLYSFTQVDLGLTLTELSIWQEAQRFFQHVGYFDRPLSSGLYIGLLVLLFSFYFLFLYFARKNLITKKQIWTVIIATATLLTFSYNAFSHDLFNYIFDAKIVTYYNQNPYLHKALDYAGEPMLAFMHWTHRTYPYGPTWLGLTVPLSFVGSDFFLLTFFMFKALLAASYVGTAHFIGKILRRMSPKSELAGIVFFALNPLVIIESLISSHNDIAMLFFAVWGFYLYLNNKYIRSIILIGLSVGVKFATIFMLPVLFYGLVAKKSKSVSWKTLAVGVCAFMTAAVVVASVRTNFQPWYLLYVLPFGALISGKYFISLPLVVMSFTSLLLYFPYLYTGNWDPPIPTHLLWITVGGVMTSLVLVLSIRLKNLLK
ncbi:MAG: hypothetical protein WD967_00955 [Candidatus Levyibacteriota bacterium]